MFKQNSKYRLHFLVFGLLLFIYQSVWSFYQFAEKRDGMHMIGGIAFGLMVLFYVDDIYEYKKNKKRIN